ncbi:MAG: Uma2 family endonuclease [Oscillospiraceae bacterium]|nr:Uma2 family endonuclease [Oscillospiraceae bacterium]
MLARKLDEYRYTYADYASWDDDTRYEIIDGIPVAMAAPTISHQRICGNVYMQFRNFLRGKKCEVFMSPVDVCLFGKGDSDKTVVQPDVFVVCDKEKLNSRYCNGAPDLVIEVLSPSSKRLDREIKKALYCEAGVREYWLVDPELQTVTAHFLADDSDMTVFNKPAVVPVRVLDGFEIDLADVFE